MIILTPELYAAWLADGAPLAPPPLPPKSARAKAREAARRSAIRAARAIAAGRQPGQTGRPITSSHPQAKYHRTYYRTRLARNKSLGSNENGVST